LVCKRPAVFEALLGGLLDRLEDHRARVGVLFALHDRAAHALAPHLELQHGGSAEGVARGQQDLLALARVLARELADGRGLADAVDADDQDHRGLGGELERLLADIEDRGSFRAQRFPHAFFVRELAGGLLGAQRLEDPIGHPHADVGGDEDLLDLLE
jgi:hypothetical protein